MTSQMELQPYSMPRLYDTNKFIDTELLGLLYISTVHVHITMFGHDKTCSKELNKECYALENGNVRTGRTDMGNTICPHTFR